MLLECTLCVVYLKAIEPDDALKPYIVLYPISYNPIMAQERLNGNFELQQYPGMHSVMVANAPRC